jgi:hypothetical protein
MSGGAGDTAVIGVVGFFSAAVTRHLPIGCVRRESVCGRGCGWH